MRIIDRYTLFPAVKLFVFCIATFLFLFVIIDILSHLDDIIRTKTGIEFLIEYYISYVPVMFVQFAPFACLLSTLYTFGTLNHNNEIIAMRSSGMSIFQITKTALIFGAVVSLMLFWMNDRFIPTMRTRNADLKRQMEEGGHKKADKQAPYITNLSMYGLKNRLFFINKFVTADNSMHGIIVLEHDAHQNLVKKIVATTGRYDNNIWKFYQSVTYNFDRSGRVIDEPSYLEEEIMTIPETPDDFISQRQRSEFMTITQLDDYIWRLTKSGANNVARNLRVDLYQRFTSPFASVIIIFLGIPFALKMKKRATGLSSIGIAIMVAFMYYIIDAVSTAFGKGGILPPFLAASLAHLIALSWSVHLISIMP